MPKEDTFVTISCNNSDIENLFLSNELAPEIKFKRNQEKNFSYSIYLIDTQKDLSHISQNLINLYNLCRENDAKLAVVILHGSSIDIEKNHYFQKMLDDLGKDKPLHRLIFTLDLYQRSTSIPATPLDFQISKSIKTNNIDISEKGENFLFPLSLEDFTQGVIKTMFLSNTSGKSFWLLGDPLPDLEFAYLLKKSLSANGQVELEINATGKSDPKINSLLSVGNITRSELNWNPENEIIDDLKQIVSLYSEESIVIEKTVTKTKLLHRLINWLYRPRPKKENQLPTIFKIFKKSIFVFSTIFIVVFGAFVFATGMSLRQLEKSTEALLTGNIKQSTSSLAKSSSYKSVGESTFQTLVPVVNLVAPRLSVKVFNLFSFIDYTTTSLGNLHQTYVMAEKLLFSLNSSDSKVNYSDLSLALHSNLSQIYENLNQITLLSNGNKLPAFVDKKIKSNSQYQNIQALENQVVQFIKISDLIPDVLSGDKPKSILVLLQNSQITRPSGGVVDKYLSLTLDQGRLISKKYYSETELSSLSVATLSALPKNKKNSPSPVNLKNILENSDFSQLSANLASFVESVLKTKPDIIIATNNHLIDRLLIEEKSSQLAKFQEEILTSTGPDSFQTIFDQYLERLFNHDLPLPIIGKTLANQIENNQVYIWSANTNTQRLLATQSYSGAIIPHPCNVSLASTESCVSESSYLGESVQVSTRSNPWQNRQIIHSINIGSTSIRHEYQVNYVGSASSSSESAYTTIYNLYQNSPSTLDQILLNDLPSSMKDVAKKTNGLLDLYQIPIILTLNQDNHLVIKTSTNPGHEISTPYSYSLTEYRQPGDQNEGISLKITYPGNLRPSVATSQFISEPNSLKLILPLHTTTFGFTLDQNRQ